MTERIGTSAMCQKRIFLVMSTTSAQATLKSESNVLDCCELLEQATLVKLIRPIIIWYKLEDLSPTRDQKGAAN